MLCKLPGLLHVLPNYYLNIPRAVLNKFKKQLAVLLLCQGEETAIFQQAIPYRNSTTASMPCAQQHSSYSTDLSCYACRIGEPHTRALDHQCIRCRGYKMPLKQMNTPCAPSTLTKPHQTIETPLSHVFTGAAAAAGKPCQSQIDRILLQPTNSATKIPGRKGIVKLFLSPSPQLVFFSTPYNQLHQKQKQQQQQHLLPIVS